MSDRISKFIVCLMLAPVLSGIMILLAIIMLLLPLLALIKPDIINFGESDE